MISKDYSDIGAVLRLAREDLQLSIKDASSYLHIRPHYLQALENGKLEELPSPAYAKGYLQSYANFLRLDTDEIIRRFEQAKSNLPDRGFFFPQVFSTEKKPTNQIVMTSAAVVFLLYLLWVLLFKPASVPEFTIEPPPQPQTTSEQAPTQPETPSATQFVEPKEKNVPSAE